MSIFKLDEITEQDQQKFLEVLGHVIFTKFNYFCMNNHIKFESLLKALCSSEEQAEEIIRLSVRLRYGTNFNSTTMVIASLMYFGVKHKEIKKVYSYSGNKIRYDYKHVKDIPKKTILTKEEFKVFAKWLYDLVDVFEYCKYINPKAIVYTQNKQLAHEVYFRYLVLNILKKMKLNNFKIENRTECLVWLTNFTKTKPMEVQFVFNELFKPHYQNLSLQAMICKKELGIKNTDVKPFLNFTSVNLYLLERQYENRQFPPYLSEDMFNIVLKTLYNMYDVAKYFCYIDKEKIKEMLLCL